MADTKKKRRVVKKAPETIREKRAKAADAKPKRHVVRSTAKKAASPVSAIFKAIAKALKPLSPLLKPFKTHPARFVGRILAKVLFIGYIRNSWTELRQVTWPNRRQTVNLTIAVFVFAGVLSGLIMLLDYGLDKVFKQLLT